MRSCSEISSEPLLAEINSVVIMEARFCYHVGRRGESIFMSVVVVGETKPYVSIFILVFAMPFSFS